MPRCPSQQGTDRAGPHARLQQGGHPGRSPVPVLCTLLKCRKFLISWLLDKRKTKAPERRGRGRGQRWTSLHAGAEEMGLGGNTSGEPPRTGGRRGRGLVCSGCGAGSDKATKPPPHVSVEPRGSAGEGLFPSFLSCLKMRSSPNGQAFCTVAFTPFPKGKTAGHWSTFLP